MRPRARPRTSPPYSHFAVLYDEAVGIPAFQRTRMTFERLIRHYGIRFRSAADIGCGTGLFAAYLARCWRIPVLAVDRAAPMLRMAIRNVRGLPVSVHRQDIRWLQLPRPVDLITMNFDTLNHLLRPADVRRALRRISINLVPGGHLVFDVVTGRYMRACSVRSRRFLTARGMVEQRIHWDPRRRRFHSAVIMRQWTLPAARTIELHDERAYDLRQIGSWLHLAGFTLRGVHDATTLATATPLSERAIIVAQRRLAGPSRAHAPDLTCCGDPQ